MNRPAPTPRLAPPDPRRTRLAELRAAAKVAGVRLMPWQVQVGRFLMAETRRRWTYPEVAVVVARQNGKSTLLIPRIVAGLLRGERIMHTAQNRQLPSEVYRAVAAVMTEHFAPAMVGRPRFANGQEVIRMRDGGVYRIVAPNTAGARGYPNDLVIVDEVRELDSFDFVAAAKPTLTTSRSPQFLYLSNAGSETSVVLNSLRDRAGVDPSLAYIEWSAAPDRPVDDREGWREANPALGHTIDLAYLEREYESWRLAGQLAVYETEHLCRWVTTMARRVVTDLAWSRARRPTGEPVRPAMGVSVDASGTRASAAVAWRQDDGTIAARLAAEVTGDPIDLDAFGADLKRLARQLRVRHVGFDPWTDRDLARHFRNAKPVAGQEFANASMTFARTVEGGQLRFGGDDQVGADLAFTSRKDSGGAWTAGKSKDDRPITAALALIRAVWLASAPRTGTPNIY